MLISSKTSISGTGNFIEGIKRRGVGEPLLARNIRTVFITF
jgi:hypothetical protein